MYVGEIERSLKSRFKEHRRPSSTTSEVTKHIYVNQFHHSMKLNNTKLLTSESRWFEPEVKEAIYIRALIPSLNRDGGRYSLSPVCYNIKKRVNADRGGGRGPRYHLAQCPRQYPVNNRTVEDHNHHGKLLQVNISHPEYVSLEYCVNLVQNFNCDGTSKFCRTFKIHLYCKQWKTTLDKTKLTVFL